MFKNLLVTLLPILLPLALVCGCCNQPAKTAAPPPPPRPAFSGSGIKTIAVLPFHASTDSPYTGTELAQMVADAIKQTGKYKVYGPNELPYTPPEFYPRTDYLAPTPRELAALRTIKGLDAYVTGTADFYAGQLRDRREHAPRYPESRDALYTATSDGIDPYYEREYLNEVATVALSAKVVSLSDGRKLWSTPAPAVVTTAYCGWCVRSPVGLYQAPTDKALQMLTLELALPPAKAQTPIANMPAPAIKALPATCPTPTTKPSPAIKALPVLSPEPTTRPCQ